MDQIIFSDFPNELIELTLSFVKSNKRRRIARSVCKTWSLYIGQVHFDIYVPLESEVQSMAETFSRCDQFFSLTLHKADNLQKKDYKELLCNLTRMISLDMSFVHRRFNFEAGRIRLDKLTNIQRLSIPYLSVDIDTVLPHLTYLESAEVLSTDSNNFPNLEHFSIKRCNVPLPTFPIIPKLTTLKYEKDLLGPRINDYTKDLKVLHLPRIGLKGMILSLPNIEEITLVESYKLDDSCSRLTKLDINGVKNFGRVQAATNLRELDIGYADNIPERSFSFMKDMKQLNSLNLWLGDYSNYTGEFLNYLIPNTLTKLTAGYDTNQINNNISPFTNLRHLKLWIEKKADLKILSTLTQLTWLSLEASLAVIDMHWISRLTSLERLYLSFKSDSKTPLDLNNLANLTFLHVQSLKSISPLPTLTKLRSLEFIVAEDYAFISKLTNLTSLHCNRSAAAGHVTCLRKIRELDITFASQDQLVALTGLQKLTLLIANCSFESISVDTLTLLTRLQSVAFSTSARTFGSRGPLPWSEKDAVPHVAEKLPRLVYRPSAY